MNQRVVSLMDVLAPPGNDWLKEISRRRSDLPAGVHVVLRRRHRRALNSMMTLRIMSTTRQAMRWVGCERTLSTIDCAISPV